MHQGETHMTARPRYLRATVVSIAAAAIIPTVAALLIALDIRNGPPVKASEAQGMLIFLVHAVAAVCFVAVAYPIVGWRLFKKQALTRSRFCKFLFYSLAGASVAPAAALAFIGFGTDAFVLVPASFAVLALLALPFRPLWFRFAQ